jgi:hypothetical protein
LLQKFLCSKSGAKVGIRRANKKTKRTSKMGKVWRRHGIFAARFIILSPVLLVKKIFQLSLFAAFALSATLTFGQNSAAANDIKVSEKVLKTAEWAKFKYLEELALAKSGDLVAIKRMLEFSKMVDGGEAIDHAVVCLELIPLAGDDNFATVVAGLSPKLREALLKRFNFAQGRSEKETLRLPMTVWAPHTWGALNGLPTQPKSEVSLRNPKASSQDAKNEKAGSIAPRTKNTKQ